MHEAKRNNATRVFNFLPFACSYRNKTIIKSLFEYFFVLLSGILTNLASYSFPFAERTKKFHNNFPPATFYNMMI